MAIAFLDDINLNDNQAENLVIQRIGTLPAGVEAKIVYDNGSNTIKYYNGTGWIELDGAGGLAGSGTVGTVPVFVTNTTTLGDSRLETTGSGTSQAFTFNTTGSTSFKGDIISTGDLYLDAVGGKGGLKDKDGDLGTAGQLLSSTGTATNWINAPVSYTKWIAEGAISSSQDVNDGDTYKLDESTTNPGIRVGPNSKSGTTITQPLSLFTKNITLAPPASYNTDIILWGTSTSATNHKVQKTHIDDIPVSAWGQAGDTVDMGDNFIVKVLDPVNAQDAATKNYVDNAIVGGFNVKGGFNAATGVTAVAGTNLYTNTAVAVGDYYVVTVAGNFFGNAATPLTPGDSVLAQTAAASGSASESNFAVIQSDTDIATASQIGIGNVNVNGPGSLDGLKLSYSSGTATVGVDIKNNASTFTAGAEMQFLVYDGGNTANNLALPIEAVATYVNSANSFAGTSSSGTSHTFNHNLNTLDVIVQVYDASNNETVYASVDRTSVNQVVVTTASSANIRCLIQKIG